MQLKTRIDKAQAQVTARLQAEAQAFSAWLAANTTPQENDAYWRVYASALPVEIDTEEARTLNTTPSEFRDLRQSLLAVLGDAQADDE